MGAYCDADERDPRFCQGLTPNSLQLHKAYRLWGALRQRGQHRYPRDAHPWPLTQTASYRLYQTWPSAHPSLSISIYSCLVLISHFCWQKGALHTKCGHKDRQCLCEQGKSGTFSFLPYFLDTDTRKDTDGNGKTRNSTEINRSESC